MYSYAVVFETPSPSFQNTEVEVTLAQSAIVRKLLADALSERKPIVHGRDWDYSSVQVRDFTVIEADYYTLSKERTAHFYRRDEDGPTLTYLVEGKGAGRLIGSITNVIELREATEEEVRAATPWTPWYKEGGFPPGTFTDDMGKD